MQSGSYVRKLPIDKAPMWKNRKSFLGRLDMELTERCNNKCVHCCINLPADNLGAKKKELSSNEIKNILREAVSLGCLIVRFTGGEPLLRGDFEELYIFAREIGLKVLLFTNATLIDRHLAELFVRIPPLEVMEVTVYGMKKSSYEKATLTSGSFEAAWRGINLLLEKKIPFMVKGALLPGNKNEIEEFEEWAATIPWMHNPPAYAMFFDLRCRRDSRKDELIKKLRVSPDEWLKILTRGKDRYLKETQDFCSKFMRPAGDKLFSCEAGCGGGCVDAYGNFQLCIGLRHRDTVYDLKGGSLQDALVNFFPRIREIRSTNPEYLKRCAKCFLKGLCEQCPAKSWLEHGTLDTPVEYLCEIAHTHARFLSLIKKREKAWQVENWKARITDFAQ